MPDLRAYPLSIINYGKQVDRAARHLREARSYMAENCDLDHHGGGKLFKVLFAMDRRVHSKVSSFLKEAATLLDKSADALVGAGHYYQRTDEASAERLDRALGSKTPRHVRPGVQE